MAKQLIWSASPLFLQEKENLHWARGSLRVRRPERGESRVIPFSSADRNRELAVQKALSELAERSAWYEAFHRLYNQLPQGAWFHTIGWAAHKDGEAAKLAARREFLERYLFDRLIHALRSGRNPEGLNRKPLPSGEVALVWNYLVPGEGGGFFSFAMRWVRDPARSCGTEAGAVFGLGKGGSAAEACETALAETRLIQESLEADARLRARAPSETRKSLAHYDQIFFGEIFRDPQIRYTLSALPETNESTHILDARKLPSTKVRDVSALQPDGVRGLGRSVAFCGEVGDATANAIFRLAMGASV